jgi:hypothetical protein
MKKIARQLTFATVIACLARFVALGGASYAALKLPKDSVGTKQLKKRAVTAAKVKPHSLLAKDFKSGQLPRGATGATGAAEATGPQGAAGAPGASAVAPTEAVPHVRVTLLNSKEAIANASRQVVDFDSVVEDGAGMTDLAKRPGTLLVPRTGLYLVAGQLAWETIVGSGRMGGIVEGSKDPGGSEFLKFRSVTAFAAAAAGFDYLVQPMSEVMRLNAGQYLGLVAFQTTGSINHLNDEGDTWLEATYLGP